MKTLLNIISIIFALIFVWGIVSFIEVNSKNLYDNPQYSSWNMFELMR